MIVYSRPPNYDKILKAFPQAANSGMFFTYYPDIYIPDHSHMSAAILAHEKVHLKQQHAFDVALNDPDDDGVEAWWDQYIISDLWRFEQELEGHRAEYQWWRTYKPAARTRNLHLIALRLSSPLYGSLRTYEECLRLIMRRGHSANRG